MNLSTKTYSGLLCRVIDALPPETSPEIVVVLCHGFGAPGDDLAAFGPHLLQSHESISARCRFVFPEAPIDLGPMGMPGGRAWWPINMAQLAQINQTRDFEALCAVTPPGMQEATEQLAATLQAVREEPGHAECRFVIGGFSQGAMITTNAVLSHQIEPDHLVLFSGTLLCQDDWRAAAKSHKGCSVIQSHGRQDMVLPFEPAQWLRDTLNEGAFDVDFIPFDGPHTIPDEALSALQNLLVAER